MGPCSRVIAESGMFHRLGNRLEVKLSKNQLLCRRNPQHGKQHRMQHRKASSRQCNAHMLKSIQPFLRFTERYVASRPALKSGCLQQTGRTSPLRHLASLENQVGVPETQSGNLTFLLATQHHSMGCQGSLYFPSSITPRK